MPSLWSSQAASHTAAAVRWHRVQLTALSSLSPSLFLIVLCSLSLLTNTGYYSPSLYVYFSFSLSLPPPISLFLVTGSMCVLIEIHSHPLSSRIQALMGLGNDWLIGSKGECLARKRIVHCWPGQDRPSTVHLQSEQYPHCQSNMRMPKTGSTWTVICSDRTHTHSIQP